MTKHLGGLIWTAIKKQFVSLIREIKSMLGLETETPTSEVQEVVNKTVAGMAVVAGVILTVLPFEPAVTKSLANALFAAASWLWNGKEPHDRKGDKPRLGGSIQVRDGAAGY